MVYSKIVNEDAEKIIELCNAKLLVQNLKNSSFLITGASGMIGSYIVYTLLKLNEKYKTNIKINALVRNKLKLDNYIKNNSNVNVIESDIINPIKIAGNIDYIIHAASPASPKIMKKEPVETNFANTIGTANTLLLAKEKNVKGYMFISSREIYGEPLGNQKYFTEDGKLGMVDPLLPRNGYAEGKKAAENMCSSFKEEYKINTKIVRLAHTYGPGMSINDGRVQADFLNNIVNNKDIVLKSDGSSIRTYTYISDVIVAIFLILLNSKDIVYNVADEKSIVSIKELAEKLIKISHSKNLKIVYDIPKVPEKGTSPFKNGILSSKKIRRELGWKPQYSIEEGFKRTLLHLEEELNSK